MLTYAKDFQKYKMGDSIGFPSENTTAMLNEVGSVVIPNILSSNLKEVHFFLFEEADYVASTRVQDIEAGIEVRAAGASDGDEYYEEDEDTDYEEEPYNDYNDYDDYDADYSGGYGDYNDDYDNYDEYYGDEDSSYWE